MTEQPMAERIGPRTLRFERRLAHPPERVWRALTDPAELAIWLVAAAELEPRLDGAVTLRWAGDAAATGRIVVWQPPEELAYTWDEGEGESLVRFSLTADGDGTRVVLTHERIDSLSGFGAGWHAHLDMLEGLLDGRPVDWQERWDELRPRYEEVMSG